MTSIEDISHIFFDYAVYFADSINIVLILLSILLAIIALGYKLRASFTAAIVKFIKELEADKSLTGKQKMEMLISWVKQLIPNIFLIVFNDKVLTQIAQNIYDNMKEYRNIYVKNHSIYINIEDKTTLIEDKKPE